MGRIARIVVPGLPHHVTQRGVRKQQTFFTDADRARYVATLAESSRRFGLDVWAWCLMPNHVHLVAVPRTEESLAKAVGRAHWQHALGVNRREDWQGHLWQERFYSCPLDARHALAVARYVELNPVRAGLAEEPGAYRWSSAALHLTGKPDGLTARGALDDEVADWRTFLGDGLADGLAGGLAGGLEAGPHDEMDRETAPLGRHTMAGWPLGSEAFLDDLERRLGRPVRPPRRGRRPRRT